MGPSPRCYTLSFVEIGLAVPKKKIFEGVLPYMGMAAILVMWPGPREQTFVPPSHGGSTWNLASIGPAVLEKMFENIDRQIDIQTTALPYDKLTNEPSAQVSYNRLPNQYGKRSRLSLFGCCRRHMQSAKTDQTARLIWVFAGRASLSVGFALALLIVTYIVMKF